MTEDKRKRLFLSYAYADKQKAMILAGRLQNIGFEIVTDYKSFSFDGIVFDEIKYLFQSSDLVLVLLSKSLFQSEYFRIESMQDFFRQAKERKISILFVLIERCSIPSDFLEYEVFNLTTDPDKGLEKLIQKIRIIPEISLDNLSNKEFDELIYDLLKTYGFKNIKKEPHFSDGVIDYTAEYFSRTPFGQRRKDVWFVDVKFYSESRLDIKTIQRIIGFYKRINKQEAKLLLITNGQLNSVVEEYLTEIKKEHLGDIEVIDGLFLKKIIACKQRIVKKYFLR